MGEYEDFILKKEHYHDDSGFEPLWLPDFLFPFQRDLVEWSVRKGRAALFADCGMGKTPMYLVWAENVVRKTNGRVIILTPLAVADQVVSEGEKFGIEVEKSRDGKFSKNIVVTNYERLRCFDPGDFDGCCGDESSIIKNFNGSIKSEVTQFMRKMLYRMLATATAAPNDYPEVGTSSEALGYLGYMDMLNRFFKNEQGNSKVGRHYGQVLKWRMKPHAEPIFWRWMTSWARAVRKPSDLGYDDGDFILPELIERQHEVKATRPHPGKLFIEEAHGLQEQREELRMTLTERCEKVAELAHGWPVSVHWCNLNSESDLLEKFIPGAVQVSGSMSDEKKEERIKAFANGEIKHFITKPKITGFGMNWQHCDYMSVFPSHSFEQYYQMIRRMWRFGQKKPVHVDLITTPGLRKVLANLQRKQADADKMFTELVRLMNESINIQNNRDVGKKMELPTFLKGGENGDSRSRAA